MNLTSVSEMHETQPVLKEGTANSTNSWKLKYCILSSRKKFKPKIRIKCLKHMTNQPVLRSDFSTQE